MASTRPPDKVVKNPLLTSADQNAFFEEFAHSRLLVAPPAPLPVSTPVAGHVSLVRQDAAAAEIRGPTLTPNAQVQDGGKDPSSDQSFTEIPLTPGSNIAAAPEHPVSSAVQPPVGPSPVSSGPPPSTGFIRSAPLSRYIPSNFIQTSLPTPAPLQIFQGAPSAPVGVSLLNPTQVEQPDEAVAASPGNSVPESSQASVPASPPLQNPSVLNVQKVPDIPETTPLQHSTPVSHPPTAHYIASPPAFQQFPNSNVFSSSPQTSNPPIGFTVYSQPPTQPVNANPSVTSPPSATSPAPNIVHLTKATSIPGFPASSNFSHSAPTLPSSKSTDFPFVPVFPKPNSGNFVPNFPINLVNENPITTGLVPPQLRSSPSPLSSKHSTPPPGSQTPLLLSAERGSPSIIQAPNNSGQVEAPQVPVSLSPQAAPPTKPVSPALAGPPPQVGPPPRGNSSAYPSALNRSAVNRSGLGQHSSSFLRQSTTPKVVSESQIKFFTPAPVDNAFPPTLNQPQLGSFISENNQLTETEKPKSFLSSAASYFSLSGDLNTVQQPQNTVQQPQGDTGFYQSVNQQSIPPPPLSYSSSGATYSTTTSQSGNNFPQTVPASSSYFQPAHPTSQSSSQFFQDSIPSGNPTALFAPPSVASVPPISAGQPPPPQNQSRPSSVGSVSSLQSAGSFPPVTSPFSSNSQKPFSHLISTSYFTPISESNNLESSSPAHSVTSSQGSLSSTHQPSYTNPSLPETSNQPLPYYNPTHFTTPPSQVYNPATPAYPPYSTSPPDTANLSSPISVPPTSAPVTGQSVNSFDNISASFSQSPNTNTTNLGFSAFSTDIPQQSFVSASSFFQSASPSTQTSAAESSPVPSSLTQAVETRSPTFPTSQVDSSTYKRISPSNTPPPTYGSLDTRDPIANPNCNVEDSASSATDGRPLEPASESQTPYCGPIPTSLPPASSNQGNTYRRTSLKRPSYVPVPDLGVSHPSTELMGQSQQFPGSGTMQEEPPTALTSDGDRGQSSSPPPSAVHSQSMDFSSQVVPSVGHYRPAFHHWFFKKDARRAVWQPFSMADSLSIEQAFVSPEISEATKVPTDGGRYDVEVLLRKKTAVYWEEPPSEVRRCSWFVKSPTEARYVPYDENIAEFLEEEYKQGCLSNEWNRRIELADGEVIILHSPNSMAHHQRSSSPDNWGNPPAMQQKPRIVKRGLEDFEISEGEPTQVDHLLLVVHGIGKVCDLRLRSLVEVVDDFRSVSLQLVQSHFRRGSESGQVGRVEVLPVEWHQALHTETIDKRLADITLPSIPKAREFTNDTILDVLFYSSPMFSEKIVQAVGAELNKTYNLFMQRNPGFAGGVSLGGHSLGSLILFDVLSHQKEVKPMQTPTRKDDELPELDAHRVRSPLARRISYLSIGLQGATQPIIEYPQLNFNPNAFFAFGSPIGMFVTVRGIESLGEDFRFPTCPRFFNIFHPNDPVAYRIEALICNEMANVPPVLIPHHKGRKRMHLELKETMAHVTTALKQKLVHSVRSTWNTVYQLAMFQRPDSSLQREVDKALEDEALHVPDMQPPSPALSSTQSVADDQGLEIQVGSLNGGSRVDYVLQEAPLETFNQYISAVRSHVVYWESEDTMLLVLKEIYASMNIKPDSQVPQQILPFDINAEDHYSEYTDSIGAPPSTFIRK